MSEKTHWIIEKHGIFQMYYYAHHLGGNKNERDKFKGHKYYNDRLLEPANWGTIIMHSLTGLLLFAGLWLGTSTV